MSLNALLHERPSDNIDEVYARKNVANTRTLVSNVGTDDLSVNIVYRNRFWRSRRIRNSTHFYGNEDSGLSTSSAVVEEKISVDGDDWERALVELGSLEADDDFVPPKKSALADLEEIAEILRGPLPLRIRFPAIEHDSSSGIVSLAWFDRRSLSTFSISILGGRKLYSIFVDPSRNLTRDFPDQTLDSRDLVVMWEIPEIATTVVDIRPEA